MTPTEAHEAMKDIAAELSVSELFEWAERATHPLEVIYAFAIGEPGSDDYDWSVVERGDALIGRLEEQYGLTMENSGANGDEHGGHFIRWSAPGVSVEEELHRTDDGVVGETLRLVEAR